MEVFDRFLGSRPNQVDRLREEVQASAKKLLDVRVPGGTVTELGMSSKVGVAMQYLESWLRGVGAAAISNLMADTATAEIARSQIWQWLRHAVRQHDGQPLTLLRVKEIEERELARIRESMGIEAFRTGKFEEARQLFDAITYADTFVEFLTLPAYERIDCELRSPTLLRPLQPLKDDHRSKGDHLAGLACGLNSERHGRVLRMLRIPLRDGALDIRMNRVQFPPSVGPALLLEVGNRVLQAGVVPVSEGRHEIEDDEDIVVVVRRIVEAIPRFVMVPLAMKFPLQVEFGRGLHGPLHPFGPLLLRIDGERTHRLPGIEVPAAPEAALSPVLVAMLDEPFERSCDVRMVRVSETDESPRHVAGRAQVRLLVALDGETSFRPGVSTDPEVTGSLDPRVFLRQCEVGQDEEHPIRREVLRLVQALGAHPPALRILPDQDVRGPPFLRNEFLRGLDLRIVFCFAHELFQSQVLNGGLVVLKQPIQNLFRSQWPTRFPPTAPPISRFGSFLEVLRGQDERLG